MSDIGGSDTIRFGDGISPDDIQFLRPSGYPAEDNLEIRIKGTNDKITVSDYFTNYTNMSKENTRAIERFEFSDGTVLTTRDVIDQVRIRHGSSSDDHLSGLSDADNTLYGDAGNDELLGWYGNDTLIGGQGNDVLHGYYGDDTYIFNKGDGEDYIIDIDGEADKVRLEYEPISVVFERVNNDLRLRMPGSLDAITVSSWYSSDNYKIETFKSANGSVITHTQVDSLIQAMSSFQKDTGMTWEQAVINQPTQVQSIIQQYWTAPTT